MDGLASDLALNFLEVLAVAFALSLVVWGNEEYKCVVAPNRSRKHPGLCYFNKVYK